MGKKGKGKKGKDKTEPSEGNVQPGQRSQPGPSSEAGRGRGRGRTALTSPAAVQQQQEPYKDQRGAAAERSVSSVQESSKSPDGGGERPFFSAAHESTGTVPKGRGRGRGTPPKSSSPQSPGIPPQRADSEAKEAVSPELSASAAPSQGTKKKVLSKVEQEEILSQISGMSLEHKSTVIERMPMAKRPNHALINDRNRIALFVNYFRLKYKDTIVYHYDIDIADSTKDNKVGKSVLSQGRTAKEDIKKKVKHVEREKRRNMGKEKCRHIISEIFKTNQQLKRYCPVYDGQKNLFTSEPLPLKNEPIKVEINFEGRQKTFYVTITPVEKSDKTNMISLEPLKNLYCDKPYQYSHEIPYEVLLVYETVMSHREPPFQQVHFRNSFFSLSDRKDPLGCGLEVWFGYHQSVQLTESGPVVVINLAAKAFHKAGPVIGYASDILQQDITRIPKFRPWEIKNLSDKLRGVQIRVTHQKNPRKYKIKAVTELSAQDLKQDIKGRKISVAQYMLEAYNKRLSYPHLPCLHMQTAQNTTYIPMETCEVIAGQPKIGKLDAELTSKMIRGTAVAPQRRMDSIKRTAANIKDISGKYMGAFGLIMDINLMKVDGRIMAAPQLAYKENSIAKPDRKGVWRIEDGNKFYKIVKIDKWVLISFADERRFGMQILSNYCEFLVKSARKCGMQLDRPQSIDMYGRNVKTEQALKKAKSSGAQFAIVVLNRRDIYHSYDEVKFLADFRFNLVTQCMEDKTLGRINDQITTNVCLKINVKLGGINHILLHRPQIFTQPVIVLGIDAIHWTRGFGYPSIVSVVGSLDPTASRYALICDLQRNVKHEKISQEIIRSMEDIAKRILHKFCTVTNRSPTKIIVFRDGVSEGQFQHALDYEVSGIQRACMDLFQKYLPITFMVVQKRHQTRFFPQNPSQGVGKNLNVPPGTCVDKEITHPVFFDYFICSHEGIQGTSKPAHYTVLHDDNQFKCEELQQLCYFLCHTYVRCTRSVSLPAPVMYADLAAARAKKYADLFITPDNMSVSSDDEPKNLKPEVEQAIKNMESFENNMFYV